ncbi:uncharacterized protein [Spinacia oleracea]|uniref:Uncharacterized protein isoform X3 n=1 Tax=Spinacia oleracea TaxID=3562 RepID=A0ABM3QGM2_SPIOL|nr:uncharacterized protein LOC110787812 isoform X3 [Spinacia oleracea]
MAAVSFTRRSFPSSGSVSLPHLSPDRNHSITMDCTTAKVASVRYMAIAAALVQLLLMSFTAYMAVYKVRDSTGWTIMVNIDYKQWPATKDFQLYDVIEVVASPPFVFLTLVKNLLRPDFHVAAQNSVGYEKCPCQKNTLTVDIM